MNNPLIKLRLKAEEKVYELPKLLTKLLRKSAKGNRVQTRKWNKHEVSGVQKLPLRFRELMKNKEQAVLLEFVNPAGFLTPITLALLPYGGKKNGNGPAAFNGPFLDFLVIGIFCH